MMRYAKSVQATKALLREEENIKVVFTLLRSKFISNTQISDSSFVQGD